MIGEAVEPSLMVTARVDKDNVDSIRVLRAAGFVKQEAGDGEEKKDSVYLLDWFLLNKRLHKDAVIEVGF